MAYQHSIRRKLIQQVAVFLFLVALENLHQVCEGIPTEVSVLLGWKNQIQDPRGYLHDWEDSPSATSSPCSWTGITCNSYSFEVVRIDLSNMLLSGVLSDLLGQMQMLESIIVTNNLFSGGLPAEICSCENLQFLILRNNSLTDFIPPCFSELLHLRVMDLAFNSFNKLPANIGLYRMLSYLSFEGCDLGGSIPPEIGNLTTLKSLSLNGNHLTGSIPIELGLLQSLQIMHLDDNNLGGEIPVDLGMLHSLEYLNLASNNLTGSIPTSLGYLTSLQEVYFSHNFLSGSIPLELWNLPALITLDVSDNILSGSIPQENMAKVENLLWLNLSYNKLVGSIPSWLGNVRNLQVLSLSSNELTGDIPEQFGTQSGLSSLDLSSNLLVGPVPPNLCNAGALSVLILASNFLSGSIPDNLRKCHKLQILNLARNSFSGKLPERIGALPLLKYLDISSAGLSGILETAAFGDGTRLEELYLQNNHLNGRLPESLGFLSDLKKLDLSHNMLSGEIPTQLAYCTSLRELILERNLLSGSIPSQISKMKGLRNLDLSDNALNGSIPLQLANLQSLHSMDLSSNQLHGMIPLQLANMSSLASLNLSWNQLSGSVPVTGVFQFIKHISLTGNPMLCGGPVRFQLPPCGLEKLRHSTKILIGVLMTLSIFIFSVSAWSSGRAGRSATTLGDSERSATAGNAQGDLVSCDSSERGNEIRIFDIKDSAATATPHNSRPNSQDSLPSLAEWMPANWPWKLTVFVRDLGLTEDGVRQTCVPLNIISRRWSGTSYRGVTRNGREFIVNKLLKVRTGHDLPNLLRMLGQLQHPNIVTILGYCLGNDQSLVAILYDNLPGGDLITALGDGRLSRYPHEWSSRLEIVLGTLRALCYLHEQQSTVGYGAPLHSEITSRNIFLDSRMKAHLAVRIDISEGDTGQTSHEISPVDAFPISCTDGTDIYNFGVLLLELLTGRKVVDQYGTHIVRWFREALDGEMIMHDIMDPTLGDPSPETSSQMWNLLKLVAYCIKDRADDRPSLERMLQYVIKVKKGAKGKKSLAKAHDTSTQLQSDLIPEFEMVRR